MAVTPTTMAELNDLAKDFWTDVYVPLMNTDTPLKSQFGRLENAMFTGRKWIFGVKTAVGGGSANAGANKTLPAADEGKYDQGEATLVRTYIRMALDAFAIEVAKKRDGSFRPALAETMADRLAQHDLEVNRQLFCGGDGKLAAITTGVNSATQTPGTGTGGAVGDYGITNGGKGTRHIYEGDYVAFYSSDGSTLRGRRTVTAVDHSAGTITVDSAVNTSNGDFISRSTSDDDNKTAGEVNGLLVSVKDSGTFEGIPATGRWKSIRMHNSGTLRDVTDSLCMEMVARIRAESREAPNLIVTRPGIVLKYSETFLPLRRIDGQDVQLKAGYKPLSAFQYAGGSIPVMDDLDCPDSRMFFLNTRAFKLADVVGSEWADLDGAQFVRITDKDAIEGYIRKYWQLITVQRNSSGVLEDLNDLASIDRLGA